MKSSNQVSRALGPVGLVLRMLVPYLGVALFWFWLRSAWGTILCYHGLVLLFLAIDRPRIRPGNARGVWAIGGIAACLGAGPLAFVLLPWMTRVGLQEWMQTYGLTGWAWLLMVPYFGLLHPVMEQSHWSRLREHSFWAHLAFAGYHMLVLAGLLKTPWLILCFAVLFGASIAWRWMTTRQGGVMAACLMHVAADLGIVVAAWQMTRGS